jgi:hypothetical protein
MRPAQRIGFVLGVLSLATTASVAHAQSVPPAPEPAQPPVEPASTSPSDASPAPATSSEAPTNVEPTTAAVVPPAPPVAPSTVVLATPLVPIIAGWHNDLFFLSSADHSFFLAPTGRLQIDGFAFTGSGSNPFNVTNDYTTAAGVFTRSPIKDGFLIRRARIEVVGGFLDRFTFMLGADFASGSTPIATDDFIDARVFPTLHFQFGQFDAPFTMENRTSDKYFDFIERSLAVRAFAFPSNKDVGLMMWGETTNRLVYYSLGIFDGDGQNRINRDNNPEVIGRVFAHPLITMGGPLANLQIGGSFLYGARGQSVDYAYPAMTTAGGFTLFNPQIAGGANPVTIVPDADQLAVAGEIDIPINRFDLRAEVMWVRNDTREMSAASTDAAHLVGPTTRFGAIEGFGYYVQAGAWLWGTPGVNGRPGYENPPALNLERPDPPTPPMGLQLVARVDGMDFHYNGSGRIGTTMMSAADGHYSVVAVEGALNFWATRHVRFTIDYKQLFFPGQPAMAGMFMPEDNHMHGPHGGSDTYGELGVRVGLAL